MPPLAYSVTSGIGSINSSTGLYTAPNASGSAVVTVTDALFNTSTATVTVTNALTISPPSYTLAANNTKTFTVTGGTSPYTFSVLSGGGSINSASGLYTAPASAGSAVVRVTDSLGAHSDSNVTINAALQISPASSTIAVNNSVGFSAAGGVPPYTYSVLSGGGTVNAATGTYTASGASGSTVVRVTDSLGNTSNANVTVNPALQISPANQSVALSGTISFSTTGGVAPITYSIQSGAGSVNASGVYTAPASSGSAVVLATDSLGNTSTANVTITNTLSISPSSYTLAVNNTQTFTASGGTGPYTFSIFSGSGTVNSSTGLYTAPASAGSAVVRVTDSLGAHADANVTINAALQISPATKTVAVNNITTFTASGGVSPYVYSVLSGGGNVNSATGAYTAPAAAGSAVVRVTDNLGNTSDATVTINAALQISPANQSVVLNGTISFSTTGGVAPITYAVFSGGGSVNASGVYTAPASAGSAVVRATDSLGNISSANVTITNVIAISPSSVTLAVNNTRTFSVTGGSSPYTYSLFSGTGTVNSASGLYTAPASAGSAVVRVTDSLGAHSDANVTINAALQISPATITLAVNNATTFTASGGVSPYTYSLLSGGGSVVAGTGVYTAPASAGSAVVRVTDSLGNTSDASVTINSALQISPSTITLAVNGTTSFSASGGVSPYSYSVFAGGGSVNSSGLYTAPASTGSATVRVTDSLGNTSDAAVTISAGVQISPATITLAVNNTTTFSASGGSAPYTYSIFSGSGSVNASTGAFTAPASAGTTTVRVTDNIGNTSDATVTVNAALQISPSSQTLTPNQTVTFSTTGGVSPFTYSVFSGVGSINSASGLYTAPAGSGSAVVRVTDSLGNTSNANVTITNVLTISPASTVFIVTNGSTIFSATGGTSPYSFSCTNAGSSIDPQLGDYSAPATAGSDTCTVTDNVGATSSANITVYNALTLSPTSVTLAINGSQTFTATGGQGALTFSLVSGGGSINSSTGAYTAPATAGTSTIAVTDTLGNSLQATITIVSSLTITPRDIFLPVGSTVNPYSATLGTSPYVFSVVSGGGSIVAATGVYTAAATGGTGVVQVTDSVSNSNSTNVYHVVPVDIKSSWGYHMCALYSSAQYSNYKVKCWGYNNSGQLGYGDTNSRGDAANELGYGLPFVDLGTGKFAKEIAVGWLHTCAMLNDNTVKCWGANTYGQLGYGNTTFRGNTSGQMGDNLPTVNLGTGRTAKHIYAFGYRSCAILDNDTAKCWGRNITGQLGQGNITNYGSGAGQMGDSLPAISLGTGRTATMLAGTESTTCAVLDDGTLKCWGLGATGSYSGTNFTYYGELGLETNNKTWGNAAGQMGDSLPTVLLGLTGGQTIVDIKGGRNHYCAVISTGAVKCWGRNTYGQLGIENTNNIGDGAGEMGGNLVSAINIANGTSLAMQRYSSCVVISGGTSKCFGRNQFGNLLQGNATTLGDNAGEMTALAQMNFGTGRTVKKMATGYQFGCAILDNDRIKCWGATTGGVGSVGTGALLNGVTTNTSIGDAAGEIGDSLPYANH